MALTDHRSALREGLDADPHPEPDPGERLAAVLTMLIEEPEPGLAFGAKGVGETATIVVTAAVVAALRDATWRELNRAPVGPDDLAGLRGPAEPMGGWPPNPPPPWQTPVPEVAGLGVGQQALMTDDERE